MKYSKTAHIPIIEEIAKGLKVSGNNYRYLELGIAKARCFNVISQYFTESLAIDINKKAMGFINTKNRVVIFCDCTTDVFFGKKTSGRFNLIFIDANHDYKNVKKDFYNSLGVLAEDGIIILHDTYAPDKESAPHCKDAWKIQEELRNDKCIQFINLPFYYGLTIVKKHTLKGWWVVDGEE